MEQILILLKADLGVSHNKRDEYFNSLLASAQSEIESKGIKLDLSKVEDMMLISDYAAWHYRKRMDDIGLSKNLEFRIRNRVVKGRANKNV